MSESILGEYEDGKTLGMSIDELMDGIEEGAAMHSDDFITSDARREGYTTENGYKIVELCRNEIKRRFALSENK